MAHLRLHPEGLPEPARDVGRRPLIALEILVAADLVGTVAVSPTIENIAVLGLIVLIRTFLSFSLETEIEGVFPWRRASTLRPVSVGDDRLIPRGGRRDSAAGPA